MGRRAAGRAARAAAEKGATETAVAYLRRALEEPLPPERRIGVVYELGQREMDIRGDEAVTHLRAAYEGLEDAEEKGWAGFALARTLMFIRHEYEAAEVARGAREELPEGLDDLARALLALEVQTLYFGRDAAEEVEATAPYRDGVPGEGPGAKMLAAATAYGWENSGGPGERCAALAEEALRGDTLFEVDNGLFWVTAVVVLVYADLTDTREIWEEARAVAHRRGSLFTMLSVDLWFGFDMLRRGDLAQAQESVEAAIEEMLLWAGAENEMTIEWPTGMLAQIYVERGDLEKAARAVERGDRGGVGVGDAVSFWRRGKVELLAAEGRHEEALVVCEEYAANLGTFKNPAAAPWRSLKAEALARLDRAEEGIPLVLEELEEARSFGAPQGIGRALRVLGQLRGKKGLDDLREAVATLERSNARLEHARALLALGTALRLARKPSEAREPLRRALELGAACSADSLADRAREELRAAGVRPRREALGGVESLTPSERRVAGMAAEAMTNREIAQELFVTPKTVEVHLSNAYRKLDIRSRRELATALG